jgi:LuxR family maltose regulon positive regulatory protein
LRIVLHRVQAKRELANLKPGIELADHLIAGALQRQYVPFALETLLVRAQLHAALGDEQASLADYTHALELGEPEGFISIFVEEGKSVAEALTNLLKQDRLGAVQPDYAKIILAALPDHTPGAKRRALLESAGWNRAGCTDESSRLSR